MAPSAVVVHSGPGVVKHVLLLSLVFASAALGALASACGGAIDAEEAPPAADAEPPTVGDGAVPPGRDGGPGGPVDAAGEDARYVEPRCADAGPPEPVLLCDAHAQTGCASGEGCYPFVRYPSGPCEQERYGATCRPSGSLATGAACGGNLRCQPGNVCVITGSGTKCMRLCRLGQLDACQEGEICTPVDVAGFAACLP